MDHFSHVLILLGLAVAIVVVFHRLRVPTSLGYLLVGVILGPHTIGLTVYIPELKALAEFGVVFLLFTIGLDFSLPRLHALRHQVLWPGVGQVALTTAVVGVAVWLAGLPAAAAFVVGAVFAQSSTTIIGRQLAEQGEENTHHGRLGLAMSVFQDVTAVPFLVIIPVLGVAVGAEVIAASLGWATAKAAFAFALVFFAGRWFLGPIFQYIAQRQSSEIFTLAVLLVALLAAWTTSTLGLSLAFGGFLAGMMLGETQFRHQVESSIRPFRDVLLGLFFIGIGMRVEPAAIPPIWHWTLLGALLILISKTLIVAFLVRMRGIEPAIAWRTGLLLAVGGEFGFALVAIALDANVINSDIGQIAITSVLLSMVIGAFIIRYNSFAASVLVRDKKDAESNEIPRPLPDTEEQQVLIGGYGRVGHAIAVLLQKSGIPFLALDADPARVAKGQAEGHRVIYGSITDPLLLEAVHVERASMVVITVAEPKTALRAVSYLHSSYAYVPVIARAWDIKASSQLLGAGATHAYPETVEASLILGSTTLEMLNVPQEDINELIQSVRDWHYQPVLDNADRNGYGQ